MFELVKIQSCFGNQLVISRRKDNEAVVFPVVSSLVGRFGNHLVSALLQGMTGIFPSRCMEDIAEIFRALMEINVEVGLPFFDFFSFFSFLFLTPLVHRVKMQQTQGWIQSALASLPAKVSPAEKQQFIHDVYHTYKDLKFSKVIKNFASTLRQRR